MPLHRLILDCDPGVDDAFAIMLALAARDRIDLLGITTVAGNRPLEFMERNARRLCTLAGVADIPVMAGCPRAIIAPMDAPTPVHGHDGLGDVEGLPEPAFPLSAMRATDFIIDTLMAEPAGSVTICCIGPMTNLATAIVLEPRIVPRIRALAFMGGAATRVASVRTSDFNFYFDPHAAQIVLQAGIPQFMFGLDVTEQVAVTPEVFASLDGGGSCTRALSAMLRRYASGDPRLHDVCTIAWLLQPDLFSGVDGHVAVEHASTVTRGITVARIHPRKIAGYEPNCRIMMQVDRAQMFDLLLTHLHRLP